jgi:hypothetical protein
MITHQRLKECLFYDQLTGVFTWIKPAWNKSQYIGKIAGSIGQDGYWFITINNRTYAAGRLAWFYVYGTWPIGMIDHKDHSILNNAIDNLRDVTCAENSQNQKTAHRDNLITGLLGVRYNKEKKRFQARIQTNGRRIALGGFDTAEEAHNAYIKAKRTMHKTCII